ncbi:hypothetical protein OE88DRAFT_1664847 [Heliocybe sulcata]|uniref:PIH1 N-terminal domain-containing protein n=1 Tax=Heliocybe sulcata TaxID=5364 RepID=A0A5C3MX52_9AGAM|nr:hypothetical protein OE88DRAFT_1664847 [Heliocybe sulcata]
MPHIPVSLAPVPAFCIKSSALTHAQYPHPDAVSLAIPKARKVFVNIAFDNNVPAPPPGSDAAIDRAMSGAAPDADLDDYFVPVIVSDPREDLDKAGKPAVVFDTIFNTSLKSKSLKSLEFKAFLIELALQRIEAQSSPHSLAAPKQPALLLSRQFGTPNIKSKGELKPRTVLIPEELFTDGEKKRVVGKGKKLVEEVSGKDKGGSKDGGRNLVEEVGGSEVGGRVGEETPEWLWEEKDGRERLVVRVPKMTHALIASTTLDVEPHRIELRVPGLYVLDISADSLPVRRELKVDDAQAEWHVGEGALVLYA